MSEVHWQVLGVNPGRCDVLAVVADRGVGQRLGAKAVEIGAVRAFELQRLPYLASAYNITRSFP